MECRLPLGRPRAQARAQLRVAGEALQRRSERDADLGRHQQGGLLVAVNLRHGTRSWASVGRPAAIASSMLSDLPSLSEVWRTRRARATGARLGDQALEVHVGVAPAVARSDSSSGPSPININCTSARSATCQERLQQPVRSLDLAQSTQVPDRDAPFGIFNSMRASPRGVNALDSSGTPLAITGTRAPLAPSQDVLPHLVAARHQHVGGPRGQRGGMAFLPSACAARGTSPSPVFGRNARTATPLSQGPRSSRAAPTRRASPAPGGSHQGRKAHALDGKQLHRTPCLSASSRIGRPVQGEDGGLDAAGAAAGRELDHELLQPAEPNHR